MKKGTKIMRIIAIIMVILVVCLYGGRLKDTVEENREVNARIERNNEIFTQIEYNSGEIERIQAEYKEYELKLVDLHNQADALRAENLELWNEYYWSTGREQIMNKICQYSPDSPMCNNYPMLVELMNIADVRGVNYTLLLGIMYAESHIGVNFKPYNCKASNNRAGIKARKFDDGTVSDWYNVQYESLPSDVRQKLDGCRLYYFEDVNTMFESLANTISQGYGKCNNEPRCIMTKYVGHDSVDWLNNVFKFYER